MSESLSTIEFESLEQKYVEVKTKLKRSLHSNEKYSLQIQKLTQEIEELKNENNLLNNQIEQIQKKVNESESDISSSDEPNKSESCMAKLIHSKNQQISDLLKDIEDVEKENLVLKEKLAETKNELSTAISEISSMTSTVKSQQVTLEEQYDITKKMSSELENLQEEIELCKTDKKHTEKNLEVFSFQVNKKIDEWKELLNKKNLEIKQLKSEHSKTFLNQSSYNSDDQEQVNDVYLNTLKAALFEAETKLSKSKSEMVKYTQEIKENIDIVNKLKTDKASLEIKLMEVKENERQIKIQLNKSHERCNSLQKEVEFANKLAKVFENDLSRLKSQIKENGPVDMATSLEENQSLKVQNLLHEKQIAGLIIDINQLQEICNVFEVENTSLRHQLGIEPEATLITKSNTLIEGKKQRRPFEKLNLNIQRGYEEKIQYKIDMKHLNKKITHLSDEILELRQNSKLEMMTKEPKQTMNSTNENSKDMKALSEENEALRQGLHEILNSIQEKSESSPREIKSDILEKLLRTLDVRHISGWYHPAMRLQAELHTLEGVNNELREQLHEVRDELEQLKTDRKENEPKSKELESEGNVKIENYQSCVIKNVFNNFKNLEELKINILKIFICLGESKIDIEDSVDQEFKYIQKHMDLIHETCNMERAQLLEKLELYTNEIVKNTESGNKKNNTIYLIQEINKWKEEISKLKEQNFKLEQNQYVQTETQLRKIISLQSKLRLKEKNIGSISMQQFKNLQNSLNEHVLKYRKLLADTEEQNKCHLLELETLKQIEEDVTKENTELKKKLSQLMDKAYQERYKNDPDCLSLSQKLTNVEIEALSEKQRADHMNNLYKLVKEQLRKCEENLTEFSKYGENLLQKNISLQERVVDLEDNMSLYINLDLYKELEEKSKSLLEENELLFSENILFKKKCQDMEKPLEHTSKWDSAKEQELLGLKHQIVDLTSTSEEKLVIGQLHSHLAKCQSEQQDMECKIDFLRNEINHWERRYLELSRIVDQERKHYEETNKLAHKKISVLQNLIIKQRIQYHGYVPLITQEMYTEKGFNINKEKHQLFLTLQNVKSLQNKLEILQEKAIENNKELYLEQEFLSPHQFKRQCEFKDQQIQYLLQKIEVQENQLEKLEQQLLATYETTDLDVAHITKSTVKKPILVKEIVSQESLDPKKQEALIKILRNVESQTESSSNKQTEEELTQLKIQIKNFENQIFDQENHILESNNLLVQKEKEIVTFKGQLEEKNKHITHLEKTLVELRENRDKKQERQDNGAAGDGFNFKSSFMDEQVISLKATIKSVQDKLSKKEMEIMKYQTLLKEDRDKHSLAAANLHQELTVLQKSLVIEQRKNNSLEETTAMLRQRSGVVEKYVSQVRALEKHLAELHTQQTKLESQLNAAQQEATRWRQMAQERLIAMQELGRSLNEQHKRELTSYKTDYEKLKELSAEEDVQKQKNVSGENILKPTGHIDPEVLKLCREKDEKIKELYNKLNKVETTKTDSSVTDNDNITLTKEIEVLRKRYEILVIKERNAKDEIRELKDQLLKRTNVSARTKQSEKSIKEQLQRKINQLEKEIEVLNDKLSEQMLLNEKHKLSANEDFGKWKKQKFWQENCEKYKNKLQEREDEFQKLQQACTSFRMVIERLEREKINLENKIKTLKSNHRSPTADQEVEFLKSENAKLSCDLSALETKMEIRQQSAGALGAALMQEKLEAQERKIAVLELSAKGSMEVRNELERLHTSLSSVQKSNLCLEAENLELKMDLEKYSKETPHLQEQIQHLENYIGLLKNESQSAGRQLENVENKKVSQLERTVFILKRVVEKLQVENKRLHNGKRPISERSSSAEKMKRDYLRLKDQYTESLQKVKDLELKLALSNKKVQLFEKNQLDNEKFEPLRTQLEQVKGQLTHKTLLLDKVKALLHGAAAREKQLVKEITELRNQSGTEKDFDTGCSIEIPSPIEEVSEENNDI